MNMMLTRLPANIACLFPIFTVLILNKVLHGKTLINLFFENSTRTEKSFELAGKRLGADVISMQVASSSVKKGETLLDTAATLNAMNPDLLVVRHGSSGAPALLSQKVSCAVINVRIAGASRSFMIWKQG